jgi:hypothetical protein
VDQNGGFPQFENDGRLENMIATYMLNIQLMAFLAWNYSSKMSEYKINPNGLIDLQLFNEKARVLVAKYPKIALFLHSKIGTNVKVLETLKGPLTEDINLRPHIY